MAAVSHRRGIAHGGIAHRGVANGADVALEGFHNWGNGTQLGEGRIGGMSFLPCRYISLVKDKAKN